MHSDTHIFFLPLLEFQLALWFVIFGLKGTKVKNEVVQIYADDQYFLFNFYSF